APLRTLCERAPVAAALPCYADGEREVARLIEQEMRDSDLTVTAEARIALLALLGGDRQASRSELRKLTLFARGKTQVDLDDVLAVVTDASSLALDTVIDATFAGRIADLETQLGKALAAGTAPA